MHVRYSSVACLFTSLLYCRLQPENLLYENSRDDSRLKLGNLARALRFSCLLDQELITYIRLVVLLLLVGRPLQNSLIKAPSFQIGSGWNLAGMFFKSGVGFSIWRNRHSFKTGPWQKRKVLPPNECRGSFCSAHSAADPRRPFVSRNSLIVF